MCLDRQAQERFERLIEGMKPDRRQGVKSLLLFSEMLEKMAEGPSQKRSTDLEYLCIN